MATRTISTHLSKSDLVAPFLVFLSLLQTFIRYIHVQLGATSLFYDADVVWQPLAQQVLNGGTLYITASDNKPPLFQYLNIAAEATGEYVAVFYLFVGLANGVAAVLLYAWLAKTFSRRQAALAAFLFVASLPLVDGTFINVRSFALLGLLGALLLTNPFARGLAFATAGMFSQYILLGLPVVALLAIRAHQRTRDRVMWGAWFLAGCALVSLVSYGSVALLWGPEAFFAAVDKSILRAHYFVTTRPTNNLFREPLAWGGSMARSTTRIVFVVIPALLGGLQYRRYSTTPAQRQTLRIAGGFSLAYATAFLVKASAYYWILLLPFLSTLAAVAICHDRRSTQGDIS